MSAAAAAGCEALQIFLRAPGRWAATALPAPEAARFRAGAREAGLEGLCYAHAPYLLNLASADATLRTRSIAVLVEELRRAGTLGLAGVVLHPGSSGAGPRAEAEARCRAAISEALQRAGRAASMLFLEGTAGSGGQLGRTPAELAVLVEKSCARRTGVCLDTAHLWGAGFDLLGDGWERALGEVQDHWGREVPHLLHGNDTSVELGSHRDRHAPPGEGVLGERFYRGLLNEERCSSLPVILEIPPGEDNEAVRSALDRLRSWQRPRRGRVTSRGPGRGG